MKCRPLILCAVIPVIVAQAPSTAEEWLSQAQTFFSQQAWSRSEEAAQAALRLNPRLVDALLVLALVDTNRSQLEAAEQHFRAAAVLEPANPQILSYLGSTCLRRKSYSEAKSAFEKVLRLDSGNTVASYNLGLISLIERKPLDALRYFYRSSATEPSDIASKMGILESQLMLNDKTSAERTASTIDSLIPSADPERLRLVAMLITYSHFQTAIPILEKLQSEDPKAYDVNYNLALAYYRVSRYVDAERTVAKLVSVDPRAESLSLLGAIQEKLQRYGPAILSLQQAAELAPQNEDYWIEYASDLLQHGSVQTALVVWKSSKLQFPKSWRVRAGLGSALYLAGDFDGAADTLLEAMQLHPNAKYIYPLLGRLYEAVPARQSEVKRAFELYLRQAPEDASAQCEYGRILYIAGRNSGNRNVERAKSVLLKALALDPHLAEADLQLAIIAQSENHFEQSVALLKQALSNAPRLPDAHYRLALAYRKLSRPDLATVEFEAFEKLKEGVRAGLADEAIQHLRSP